MQPILFPKWFVDNRKIRAYILGWCALLEALIAICSFGFLYYQVTSCFVVWWAEHEHSTRKGIAKRWLRED